MRTRVRLTLGVLALTAALGCTENPQAPIAPAVESATPANLTSPALTFRQVSAGSRSHTCGVTTDDLAYCWGSDNRGQLGIGTSADPERCWENEPCSTRPMAVQGGLRFRTISAGGAHTCGLSTDDRAYCWGYNGNGELGDGSRTDRRAPSPVAGGLRFRQVVAGLFHSCGITTGGRAVCWGFNYYGQVGDSTSAVNRLTPVLVAGGRYYREIAAGDDFNCAITYQQYRVACWGRGEGGALGVGRSLTSRWPRLVASELAFASLSAGSSHTCAISFNRYTYCWGNNENGQLGIVTPTANQFAPAKILGGMILKRLDAGGYHTCGTMTSARAFCWGRNVEGELGGSTEVPPPTAVAGGRFFDQVSAGFLHTCGVTAGTAEILCWGGNEAGQLGDGTTINRPVPTRLAGASFVSRP